MAVVTIPPRLPIPLDCDGLVAIADRYAVQELALFGSVLREDFTPASDVDVLVSFRSGVRPTLLTLGGLMNDLEALVGRSVDLVYEPAIKPFLRAEILTSKEPIYVYAPAAL